MKEIDLSQFSEYLQPRRMSIIKAMLDMSWW